MPREVEMLVEEEEAGEGTGVFSGDTAELRYYDG